MKWGGTKWKISLEEKIELKLENMKLYLQSKDKVEGKQGEAVFRIVRIQMKFRMEKRLIAVIPMKKEYRINFSPYMILRRFTLTLLIGREK